MEERGEGVRKGGREEKRREGTEEWRRGEGREGVK